MSSVIYAQPIKDAKAVEFGERRYKLLTKLVLGLNPASALEIGCGDGVVASNVIAKGVRYVGLDPDPYSLSQAQQKLPNAKLIHASSDDDPQELKLGTFDVVFSTDVIEHVYDPRRFIAFAKAHVRLGGYFIVGTPNYGSYVRNLLLSLTNRWDKHHTVWWDGGHIKFFSKRTLGQMITEGGFSVERWEDLEGHIPLYSAAIFCIARLA